MEYIISIYDEQDQETLYTGSVDDSDKEFFIKEVIPSLQPISDDFYTESFCVILQTMAKWSYILYQNDLYWCIEWEPGFIVLKFTTQGNIEAVALRSPNPTFGGRTPLPADAENEYDEDEVNHPYNLIFCAWDAQFDETNREYHKFEIAGKEKENSYTACLEHANQLTNIIEEKYNKNHKQYHQTCIDNIAKWAEEGKRV